MAINKNALIRYQVLDRCFRNPGRKYFWQDLLQECNKALREYNGIDSGIKRRQLYEDMKFMESDQGWSIPLKRNKDGRKTYYRYSDMSFSINNQPLNETEVNQIKSALDVLTRFSGAQQFEWIHEMIPLLEDKLDLQGTGEEVLSFESNFDLRGLEYIMPIFNAITNGQVLEITYQDFKSDEPFQIVFHPYYLKQYNNRWFTFGLNNEVGIETWNLALDRIISIKEAKGEYISTEIDWKEYFFDVIGVTKPKDRKIRKVVLHFSSSQAPYVRTKPLHPTQKHKAIGNGLEVSIKVIPNYELESLLLSFGEHVKVIKPKMLKERIKDRIINSIDNSKT
jgi:predicted DNA-binding transcriptional regulator YafY